MGVDNLIKRIQGFIVAIIVTVFILSNITIFAESIDIMLNLVNININSKLVAKAGDSYILTNGDQVLYSIVYKGTTYLPMRKLAELLDKDVIWDGNTKTASVSDIITRDEEVLGVWKSVDIV